MIEIDPEAAFEILDARDFYEARRVGLGRAFVDSANGMLDAIDAAAAGFPAHPFATTQGTKRALFPRPWPYGFAFIILPTGPPVLACEHLHRAPLHWAQRLRKPWPVARPDEAALALARWRTREAALARARYRPCPGGLP